MWNKTIVAALLVACCTGCAVGRIRNDEMIGAAIGHAKLERTADGTVRIEGGAMSNNLAETISTALTALGAYFGLGLGS